MASDSCMECPVGKYKPEGSVYLGATMCLDCPNNTPFTLSLGSTSVANCTNGRFSVQWYLCRNVLGELGNIMAADAVSSACMELNMWGSSIG